MSLAWSGSPYRPAQTVHYIACGSLQSRRYLAFECLINFDRVYAAILDV